jgi:hypothetical protein
MNKREFIALLGGAAAWPLAARAQQAALPVVGYSVLLHPGQAPHLLAAFRPGIAEVGSAGAENQSTEAMESSRVTNRARRTPCPPHPTHRRRQVRPGSGVQVRWDTGCRGC